MSPSVQSKFPRCVMNKISLSDKPAAFLFICLCGPIVIDLEKDYAFFSLISLPPVSPLSILSIRKGRILSRLVWAVWTRKTRPAVVINGSASPAVLMPNIIYKEMKKKPIYYMQTSQKCSPNAQCS